jgi:hypothetical protein
MSTSAQDEPVPDDVPTADYLEQRTSADPDNEPSDDNLPATAGEAGRVEADELGTDVEADEGDLLEQATSVPPADDELDEADGSE